MSTIHGPARIALNLTERVGVAVETIWHKYHQPYFWAATKLREASRSNEGLRLALLPQKRLLFELVRDARDSFFGSTLNTKPRFRTVRELLNTSMRGVAMTYAIDPRSPATLWFPDDPLTAATTSGPSLRNASARTYAPRQLSLLPANP